MLYNHYSVFLNEITFFSMLLNKHINNKSIDSRNDQWWNKSAKSLNHEVNHQIEK
jgi:hypothetical protein